MKNFDKESMLISIDSYIEKAEYMAETIIERYNLSDGMVKDTDEALFFASNRENIGMEMEILRDCISNIQKSVSSLKRAVL